MGGLRETGGLPLFSPEGRTYSPPQRGGGISCGNRALCEADAAAAGSLQTMPQHLRGCCCHRLRDWANTVASTDAISPTACANLPPAALPHRWTGVLPVHFLFAKEKQKKENEVNE